LSAVALVGEIIDNRILVFAGNGGNMNVVGINIAAGAGILNIEANKLDASLSDALTYSIVANTNVNAIVKKNVNDLRVPSSGIVTVLTGQLTATLPDGNWEYYEGGATDWIKNILIRPINANAIEFMITHKITPCNIGAGPIVIVDIPVPAADLVFAWEII